ncbi:MULTISPECIES: mitochondrial fission ELM1 family protein [Thalassospira]|uniref:Nucleoside-diphosphate sugar epimerase n=2 Tax=Thalassospira TaxID=168934 RepID=A0A367W9F3_9PROT|nr:MULTISPECIES: mitochondrial fission ELM1 family protein [Thalassospira]MDG4719141.1 mitochondrial fission ELM1 family protein [Thalassospira sp. FZY0004]RCK37070.1 nucleoside-diphosphate sugar epimerase [Thalassospira profundimaris]
MSEQDTHLIWVLADDRAGNVNQAIGVAEALAQPFKRIDIGYTKLARLPNIIRGTSLMGVDVPSRTRLVAPWPDLVISAGRRTAPIARWIKKQSRGHTRICQIMRPDCGEGAFDLIAVPAHDRMTIRENILEIPGAPHRVTETRLLIEADTWRPQFKGLPTPRFAVIVGGNTKKSVFTRDMADELISKAIEAARAVDGSLMVTTSRRTGPENEALIAERLETSGLTYHLHDWMSKNENPYFGYLALADVLIVTGDSVSMCCEAAAAPGGVYIYAPDGLALDRHKLLHQSLYEGGYACPMLAGSELVPFRHPSLQPARLVAQRCLELLSATESRTSI